ncbi:MAG: hypothetical protein LBD06_11860 [Candidatus Accumulibacter sp.]|nr:hypothetical protein [Accumulibacter sp.]
MLITNSYMVSVSEDFRRQRNPSLGFLSSERREAPQTHLSSVPCLLSSVPCPLSSVPCPLI